MIYFQTEVGESDRHTIEFVLNQFWGYVEIKVDGRPYIQEKLKGVWFNRNWTYDIKVGNTEAHEVRIEIIRSMFPAGIRESSAWVYVDGKRTEEHAGKLSVKDKLFTGMNLRIKTAIIILLTILIAILSSAVVYSWPIKIDKEMEGVLFRGGSSDSDYSESMSMTIDGKYHRRLFSHDQFEGELYIKDMHPDVDENVLKQHVILNFYKGKPAYLGYWKINVGTFSDYIKVGYVYMEPGAKDIMILVVEKDENGEYGWCGGGEGLFYAAPCNTREEALDVVNGIIPKVWGEEANPII